MKHKIIHTENYLLVVDDSEIKVGDYITDKYKVWRWNDDSSLLGRKKVLAHLPLNNSPILEGVDLLPPLEDEVNKLANEYTGGLDFNPTAYSSFIDGYNKAKETYKYTEEDLRNGIIKGIIKMGIWQENNSVTSGKIVVKQEEIVNEIIQSLQQPKLPIAFECEMWYNEFVGKRSVKTTTNSQGQTVWVGNYKY